MSPLPRARRLSLLPAAAALALALAAGAALGHGRFPLNTPAERVIANLTKYVAEHPDDSDGYYRLGRAHTMALETKTGFIRAYDDTTPAEGSFAQRSKFDDKIPEDLTHPQLVAHLAGAITNLNKAISMRADQAQYHLTLACALEAGAAMKREVDVWPLCPTMGVLQSSDRSEQGRIRGRQAELEKLPGDSIVEARLLNGLRPANGWRSDRDLIMTLAYERRDDPGFKLHVLILRDADWINQIEEQNFIAMCLALPVNGTAELKPIWGGMEDWVAYEAGKNFIRVVEARAAQPSDQIRLKVAKTVVKAFDELPKPNAITPIILDPAGRALSELQSPATTVAFDLDGSGRAQTWPWLKPGVAILVWDPQRTGRITSGKQLFGSVSWWLFFDNGYQALDCLDDNRDGALTNAELRGISLWFDRNSNGASDPGELATAEDFGLTSLSCRATTTINNSPSNLTGAVLSDGRAIPTYDWIVSPIPAK